MGAKDRRVGLKGVERLAGLEPGGVGLEGRVWRDEFGGVMGQEGWWALKGGSEGVGLMGWVWR